MVGFSESGYGAILPIIGMIIPRKSFTPPTRSGALLLVRGGSVGCAGEGAQKHSVSFVAIHDDVDLVELAGVLLDEVVDRVAEAGERLAARFNDARHDTRSDGRDVDARELVLHRSFESGGDKVIERSAQVVDDEKHGVELAVVRTLFRCEHDLAVHQWHCRLGLTVEHGSRAALNCAVETAEPHAARVDCGDQGIGLDLGDVSIDHVDYRQLSLLKFQGQALIIST